MAYFAESPLKRVILPSNPLYWVDLATDFNYGDSKKLALAQTGDSSDTTMAANLFLLTVIKAWNLDDATGQVVGITQDSIDMLSRDDAIFLLNEASATVTEEESKKKIS